MGFVGTQRGFEKFDKVSKFHFEVTKKDRGFVFQISCFKLVLQILTEIWNELQIFKKNKKKENIAHIVVLCHILATQVEKDGLHTFKMRRAWISCDIAKTQTMRSKVEEKWFWNCNMKFSKTSQKLHFGVTKKDPCLVFHFHVLNLFKCWSNLGLTEFEITIINSKIIEKLKNRHT